MKSKEIIDMLQEMSIEWLKSWTRSFIKRMGFTYKIRTKAQTKLRDDLIVFLKIFHYTAKNNKWKKSFTLKRKKRECRWNSSLLGDEWNENT